MAKVRMTRSALMRRLKRQKYRSAVGSNVRRAYRRRVGTQTHDYKRFTWDYTLKNTYVGGNSDLILNVDGVDQGKSYLGVQLGSLVSSVNGTSAIGGCIQFRMDMLPGLNDFSTLYDKYKLRGASVRIIPLSNFASASNLGTLPVITAVVDQDDKTIPSDDIVLREYGNCKVKRLANGFKMYVRPKINTTIADNTGADQSAVVTSPKFLDMAQPSIEHFGVKFWLDNVLLGNTTNVNALFKIVIKYYFTCSQTR